MERPCCTEIARDGGWMCRREQIGGAASSTVRLTYEADDLAGEYVSDAGIANQLVAPSTCLRPRADAGGEDLRTREVDVPYLSRHIPRMGQARAGSRLWR